MLYHCCKLPASINKITTVVVLVLLMLKALRPVYSFHCIANNKKRSNSSVFTNTHTHTLFSLSTMRRSTRIQARSNSQIDNLAENSQTDNSSTKRRASKNKTLVKNEEQLLDTVANIPAESAKTTDKKKSAKTTKSKKETTDENITATEHEREFNDNKPATRKTRQKKETKSEKPTALTENEANIEQTTVTIQNVSTDVKTTPKKKTSKKKEVVLQPFIRPEPVYVNGRQLLLNLTQPDPLVRGTITCRPSKRNKSPYVADIFLEEQDRTAIVHFPAQDMGGKCRPGVQVLVQPSRDNKGRLVGPDAVSEKYGTPKCEFKAQLLLVDEKHLWSSNSENNNANNNTLEKPVKKTKRKRKTDDTTDTATGPTTTATTTESINSNITQDLSKYSHLYPETWIGAHPNLGERVAEQWIAHGLVDKSWPPILHIQTQVSNPGGNTNMRSDFLITHTDGTKRVVEVKTVIDADYHYKAVPNDDIMKIKFYNEKDSVDTYKRTALFPWGKRTQKNAVDGGMRVISSRAIHHVQELIRLVSGDGASSQNDNNNNKWQATVLLVVIRDDVHAFMPNAQGCPTFAKALRQAHDAGVQVIAKRVSWGRDELEGLAFDDIVLPIIWPKEDRVEEETDDMSTGNSAVANNDEEYKVIEI